MTVTHESIVSARINRSAVLDSFLNVTMGGMSQSGMASAEAATPGLGVFGDYVTIRSEVILEYERQLIELRRQVLYYRRRLYVDVTRVTESDQIVSAASVDVATTRILGSILAADIPTACWLPEADEVEQL